MRFHPTHYSEPALTPHSPNSSSSVSWILNSIRPILHPSRECMDESTFGTLSKKPPPDLAGQTGWKITTLRRRLRCPLIR
jgi:hypothetical protein